MKNIIYLVITLFVLSCSSQKVIQDTKKPVILEEKNDEGWEVVVFDGQYETFLVSRALPISQYSENSLKTRNQQLVSEWNSRVLQPFNYKKDVYEMQIDYDVNENYGLEFEYRLYQFFAFVYWKYGEPFNGLSQRDQI